MSLPEKPRPVVHVIDDDATVRQVIAAWLNGLSLIAKAYASAEQFLATYQPAEIECLLLDLQMPGRSGLDLQAMLSTHQVLAPQIVISAFGDTATAVRAMRGGAIEFLEKPLDEQRLVRAVNEALEIDRQAKSKTADLARRVGELSPREREVLALLVAAKTTAEIAATLKILPATAERHCQRIFESLEVASVPALIRVMLRPQR